MDNCLRGAFLSEADCGVSLDLLEAVRISNNAIAMKRIRVDRRGADFALTCIGSAFILSECLSRISTS